jgi:hypothetical protein
MPGDGINSLLDERLLRPRDARAGLDAIVQPLDAIAVQSLDDPVQYPNKSFAARAPSAIAAVPSPDRSTSSSTTLRAATTARGGSPRRAAPPRGARLFLACRARTPDYASSDVSPDQRARAAAP